MLKHFITFLRFACQFFGFCLSNITAARGYIKKIQKRPDIRSNFVVDEWAALEQYINNEELKNANT